MKLLLARCGRVASILHTARGLRTRERWDPIRVTARNLIRCRSPSVMAL